MRVEPDKENRSRSSARSSGGRRKDPMPKAFIEPCDPSPREKAPEGPVSIIISSADGMVYVYRNGIEIGRAPVGGLPGLTGSYVYSALAEVDAEGRHDWLSTASIGGRPPNIKDLVKQVRVDQQFLAVTRDLITPGANLILTDAPVSVSTRSGAGFNILTTSALP